MEAEGWRITTLFTPYFLASIQLMLDLGVLSEIEAGSILFQTCQWLDGALAHSLCGPGLFPWGWEDSAQTSLPHLRRNQPKRLSCLLKPPCSLIPLQNGGRKGGEEGLPSSGIDLPRCVCGGGGPAHHLINVELFLG